MEFGQKWYLIIDTIEFSKQEPKQTPDHWKKKKKNRNGSTHKLNTDQTQDNQTELGTNILY
jgi:hypothetical protein